MNNPAESYAEHARMYAWPSEYYATEGIRSNLSTLTHDEWWKWRNQAAERPMPRPFLDVIRSDDEELWQAAWYTKDEGLLEGYEDGTLGPYEPLLRRHVALVAERAGLDAPPWTMDYTPATRGEVRDVFDFEWKEERWNELLLRSQLLRLIWRAR